MSNTTKTEAGTETAATWRKSGRPAIDMTQWKVEGVIDTREWDLDENKPIPGTGQEYDCDHCGRAIEIHVHLTRKDETGAMTVGTGCLGRGVGEKYARQARAAYEHKIERCKVLLGSPFIRLYGRLSRVDPALLYKDSNWEALRERDRWQATRRAMEEITL